MWLTRLGWAALGSALSVLTAALLAVFRFESWGEGIGCDACDPSFVGKLALLARLDPWDLTGWVAFFMVPFHGVVKLHDRWPRDPRLLWIPFVVCGCVCAAGLWGTLESAAFYAGTQMSDDGFGTLASALSGGVAYVCTFGFLRLARAVSPLPAPRRTHA